MKRMVRWQRMWNDDDGNSWLDRPVQIIASVLSFFYGLAVSLRNWLYDGKILKEFIFSCPVVSIGNITVGGTGKTPCVILLTRLLKDCGYRPVVISRGYGGRSKKAVNIVCDGRNILMSSDMAGDEPVLIARSLKDVPVITGARRKLTGQAAIRLFGADLLICDDAMQHRQIHRDVNLVLMDAGDLNKKPHLLPRGKFREAVAQLRRADAIILTRTNEIPPGDGESAPLIALGNLPVFRSIHQPKVLVRADNGGEKPLSELQHKKVHAFCGIANPRSFEKALQASGAQSVACDIFPDHHRYTAGEMEKIISRFRRSGADLLITTEKDGVRLNGLDEFLDTIYVLKMEMEIIPDAEPLKNFILRRITSRQKHKQEG